MKGIWWQSEMPAWQATFRVRGVATFMVVGRNASTAGSVHNEKTKDCGGSGICQHDHAPCTMHHAPCTMHHASWPLSIVETRPCFSVIVIPVAFCEEVPLSKRQRGMQNFPPCVDKVRLLGTCHRYRGSALLCCPGF